MTQQTTEEPYFTSTTCPVCGGRVDGLLNRYACPCCGWVSPPDGVLPTATPEED